MADTITYGNKVAITPREVHENQIWDVDMNDIKSTVNSHATEIEGFINGNGKTYESIALAMAVLPLPSNNTPFTVRNSGTGEDGYYIYESSEVGGYLLLDNIRTNSITNIKDFGAIGDGLTDDTAAIQLAFNNSNNVYFPAGTYVSKTITVINDGTHIYGDGHSSILEFKTGETGVLLSCSDKRVNINNLRFFGGLTSTQRSISVSASDRNGIYIYSQQNSIINGVTIDGFANTGLHIVDTANYVWERFLVTNSTFLNNYKGIDTGLFGEYTRYSNLDITSNYIGITIRSGNITNVNSKIAKNGTGVFLASGTANNGHGNMNGCLINHNDYAIISQSTSNGYNFVACNIFDGIIKIEDSQGIKISDGIINVIQFYLDNSSAFILRNQMYTSYGNTISRFNGDTSLFVDNYFADGSFLEDISSRNILIKEANALVDLHSIGSYSKIKTSSSITSAVVSVEQTAADSWSFETNNGTRDWVFRLLGVEKARIKSNGTGFNASGTNPKFLLNNTAGGSQRNFSLSNFNNTVKLVDETNTVDLMSFSGDNNATLVKGLRLTPVTTPLAVEGMIYFDTSTKKLRCYDGTIWNDLF